MAKKKGFNVVAVVRGIARERIGQPKPTAVQKDKREQICLRDVERELRTSR